MCLTNIPQVKIMRNRKEIESDASKVGLYKKDAIMLEVWLDIRDLLQTRDKPQPRVKKGGRPKGSKNKKPQIRDKE